jgi:hypothetical protein
MTYVETEPRLGHSSKDRFQFFHSPASGLATIHVFNAHQRPQLRPRLPVSYRIGMDNDRPTAFNDWLDQPNDSLFSEAIKAAWCMKGDVPECR